MNKKSSIYVKFFNFLEKITNNKQRNGIFIIIFTIFFLISLIISIIYGIFKLNPLFFIILSAISLCLTIFFICFNKILEIKTALNASLDYIKALEEENQDYKANVDVLLNDIDVRNALLNKKKHKKINDIIK